MSKISKAVNVLTNAIKNDESFYFSYQANIAIQFQDAAANYKRKNQKAHLSVKDIHKISNDAAKAFLNLWCS